MTKLTATTARTYGPPAANHTTPTAEARAFARTVATLDTLARDGRPVDAFPLGHLYGEHLYDVQTADLHRTGR